MASSHSPSNASANASVNASVNVSSNTSANASANQTLKQRRQPSSVIQSQYLAPPRPQEYLNSPQPTPAINALNRAQTNTLKPRPTFSRRVTSNGIDDDTDDEDDDYIADEDDEIEENEDNSNTSKSETKEKVQPDIPGSNPNKINPDNDMDGFDEFEELDEAYSGDNGTEDDEPVHCLWFRNLPAYVRGLLLIIIGSLIILTPAVCLINKDISRLPNLTSDDIDELERLGQLLPLSQLVRWCLWLTVAWNLAVVIWFFVGQLPYLIELVFKWIYGDCSERVRSNLDYIPSLRLVIHFAIWSVFAVASHAVVFKQMVHVQLWMSAFQFLCMLMIFSVSLLAQRLSVQTIAVNFHRVAYADRVGLLKRSIRALDRLRRSIKTIGLTDIFDLDLMAGAGKGAANAAHLTDSPMMSSMAHLASSEKGASVSGVEATRSTGPPEMSVDVAGEQLAASQNKVDSNPTPVSGSGASYSYSVDVSDQPLRLPNAALTPHLNYMPPEDISMIPLKNPQFDLERKSSWLYRHPQPNEKDEINPTPQSGSGLQQPQQSGIAILALDRDNDYSTPHGSNGSNGDQRGSDLHMRGIEGRNDYNYPIPSVAQIPPSLHTIETQPVPLSGVSRLPSVSFSNKPPTKHKKQLSAAAIKSIDFDMTIEEPKEKLSRGKTIANFFSSLARGKTQHTRSDSTKSGATNKANDPRSLDRSRFGRPLARDNEASSSTARRRGRTQGLPTDASQDRMAGTAMTIGGASHYQRSSSIDLISDKHAIKLARKLFVALGGTLPCHATTHPDCKTQLTVDMFRPYFSSDAASKEAFDLFDSDSNGSLSLKEMKHAVLRMYRERRNLFGSLHDLSQALGRLNQILYAFSILLTALFSLPIYGIPLTAVLPFTSILVALSFIFGGAAKTTFDCIVFLFVTHPYDTGDRVLVDGVGFRVIELNLLTTVFENGDGRTVYAPNAVLSQKMIHNIRRSGDQSEAIDLQFDFDTPEEILLELHARMLVFVKTESRDYLPSCDLCINDFENTNRLKISITVKYRGELARRA
ncbi:hypothetical protein BSLG_004105 [Batrachochytrium salamandrivorans]|nr:hypothetical protein BSLG_004105 [Batrachochytrium salamandrivorans]